METETVFYVDTKTKEIKEATLVGINIVCQHVFVTVEHKGKCILLEGDLAAKSKKNAIRKYIKFLNNAKVG